MDVDFPKNKGPILVFDSGLGGLSVVQHLRALLPTRALAYLCDNAALPYGTKADDWLIERINQVCQAAVHQTAAQILVVACNTASTLALDKLRVNLTIPVVGTVPAIKPAVALSQTKTIAVLATSATIRRPYLDTLIEQFSNDCQVLRIAADSLVMQAEYKLRGLTVDKEVVRNALKPIFDQANVDTVVLGCTHFPLLMDYFQRFSPRLLHWVDSGSAIARRVQQLVPVSRLKGQDTDISFATAPQISGLNSALGQFGFAPCQAIAVP